MNREDELKEHRKWRLWEFVGAFISIFHFRPWRDLTMGRTIMPRLDREPPLVALDKIAQEGLKEAPTMPIAKSETVMLVLDVFKAVAAQDGVISDEERNFVRSFLQKHRSAKWQEDEINAFLLAFDERNTSDFSLKNSCFLISKHASEDLRQQIFEALYQFGYLHVLLPAERRLVDQIGEWLGLNNSTLRAVSLRAFRQSQA